MYCVQVGDADFYPPFLHTLTHSLSLSSSLYLFYASQFPTPCLLSDPDPEAGGVDDVDELGVVGRQPQGVVHSVEHGTYEK